MVLRSIYIGSLDILQQFIHINLFPNFDSIDGALINERTKVKNYWLVEEKLWKKKERICVMAQPL
jgi:hypothetical protein